MPLSFALSTDFDTPEWAGFIEALPDVLGKAPSDSRLLGGRNELHRLNHAGQNVVVKRFKNRGLWKKVAYRLVSSKAMRSYSHSLALIEAGVGSPTPIAWREDWGSLWLKESHYICSYLDFEHDASALLHDDCEDRDIKITLLGNAVARMHEAGLLHLDINQGNWLFQKNGSGNWIVSMVDNNRLRRVRVGIKKGVHCLLQLEFKGEFLRRLVNAYAEGRGEDFETCWRSYERSRTGFELKWRIKNATRPWRRKIGL